MKSGLPELVTGQRATVTFICHNSKRVVPAQYFVPVIVIKLLCMKTIAAISLGLISSWMICSCSSSETDSVKQAQKQNQNSAIDEDISEFLTEAADARMMDLEQGKLAKERGTTAAIRQYGEWMITDQTK